MQKSARLKDLAVSIVSLARSAGATDAEVVVREGFETEVEVREGNVDKLHEGGTRSVGIRIWRGDRSASSFATDLSGATISQLIDDAVRLADLSDPVPEQALPDADLFASGIADLELFDEAVEAVPATTKLQRAREVESIALGADHRVSRSAGASYGDVVMARALANSRGFAGGYDETWTSIGVSVIADDEGGKKRNGAWSSSARYVDQLESIEFIGNTAAARAVRQLSGGPIETCRMPVVFDPLMAASLVGTLFGVLTGGAIERRTSFLLDRMGQLIASPLLTIIDDPTLLRAPGSRPYDGEGLATVRTAFVDQGVLRSWALNSYHARRLGLRPTGHASRPASGAPGESPSNLFVANGSTPVDALIGGVERGLYCESMMGFGFNPTTGDFSRGASGRLIEKGRLTTPVSEITISANLGDILRRIDAVGDDLSMRRSVNSPTIRVSEMTIGGR